MSSRTRAQQPEPDVVVCDKSSTGVSRWEGGAKAHHLATINDYVTPEEAAINQKIVDLDPANVESNKSMRRRDRERKDGKVRNPLFTSASLCLVCKYAKKKKTWTTKYCVECTPQPGWPKTNRASGFQCRLHPRLCSVQCFEYFHTHRIPGLDFNVVGRSRRKRARKQSPTVATTTTTSSEGFVADSSNLGGVRTRIQSESRQSRHLRRNRRETPQTPQTVPTAVPNLIQTVPEATITSPRYEV